MSFSTLVHALFIDSYYPLLLPYCFALNLLCLKTKYLNVSVRFFIHLVEFVINLVNFQLNTSGADRPNQF